MGAGLLLVLFAACGCTLTGARGLLALSRGDVPGAMTAVTGPMEDRLNELEEHGIEHMSLEAWLYVLLSGAGTTAAGMGALNKYRNTTRAKAIGKQG